MKTIRHIFAALAVLALGACFPPTTSKPVGTTVGFKTDPALEGLWRTQPDPDSRKFLYYHLLNTKDGTMFAVIVPSRGGDFDMAVLKLTTVGFGDFGYLNARWMMDPKHEVPDQSPGTIPVLYRFGAKGELEIYIPDEGATDAAIQAHRIAGKVDNGGADHTALVTADGPALDRFFRSATGRALYKKPFAVLTRVK